MATAVVTTVASTKGTIVASNKIYQNVPPPVANVGALAVSALAVKTNMDILTGATSTTNRAVLFSDLTQLGILSQSQLPNSSGIISTTITVAAPTSFATIAADTLVGNPTASTAAAQAVTLGSGLAFSGTSLGANWALGSVTALSTGLSIATTTLTSTYQLGKTTALSSGLSIVGTTLTVTFPSQEWTAGSVSALSTGLSISGTTLTSQYQAGSLTTFGTGLTLTTGTLTPNYTAGALSTFGTGLTLTTGTLTPNWQAGVVSTVGTGLSLTSGTLTATSAISRDYLAGMILSNDSTTPNSVLDVAAGQATDSTQAVTITLGTFTKSTAGAWAAGSGGHGMGTGLTIANSTWYHVFAIINAGSADVYFDTSVTAANAPTSTTAFRRIGSFVTDGSAHITLFTQTDDTFMWYQPSNNYSALTPGVTTAVTYSTSTPPGVICKALLSLFVLDSSTTAQIYLSSLADGDYAAALGGAWTIVVDATHYGNAQVQVLTNTSAEIRGRVAATTTELWLATLGWVDQRGKDA